MGESRRTVVAELDYVHVLALTQSSYCSREAQ
jgi:hypothetical protein